MAEVAAKLLSPNLPLQQESFFGISCSILFDDCLGHGGGRISPQKENLKNMRV
jgi:hypothetical protein